MLGYSMTIPGGFKSIIADTPAFYGSALSVVLSIRLPEEPRGLYEVRVAVQTSEMPYRLQYQIFERMSEGEEIPRGKEVVIESGAAKEVESLEEFDFMDEVKDSVRVVVLSDA